MLQKGDIIRFDYSSKEVLPGEGEKMLESTVAELAKEGGIFAEGQRYAPYTIVIGSGILAKGLEDAIIKANVGDWADVVVPPSEHFGERKAEMVKIYNQREFQKEFRKIPSIGMIVTGRVDNKSMQGRVTDARTKRVRVDFNHPMAGKTLHFTFKVVKVATEDTERAIMMLEHYFPLYAREFTIETYPVGLGSEPACIVIGVPGRFHFDENWQKLMKFKIVSDLRAYLPQYKSITFIEQMEFTDIMRESSAVPGTDKATNPATPA